MNKYIQLTSPNQGYRVESIRKFLKRNRNTTHSQSYNLIST